MSGRAGSGGRAGAGSGGAAPADPGSSYRAITTNPTNPNELPRRELLCLSPNDFAVGDSNALDFGGDDVPFTLAQLKDRSVSWAGSIFTMTGPWGAPAPLVAYDFTKYDPTKTLAQNLVAANVTGDAAFDLAAAGTPGYGYAAGQGPGVDSTALLSYGPRVHAASPNGGCLRLGMGQFVQAAGDPAALHIAGSLTVEWLGVIGAEGTIGSLVFFGDHDEGGSETPAGNQLYNLLYVSGEGFKCGGEYQGGLPLGNLVLSPAVSPVNALLHLALVRAYTGHVQFFINGKPTGGPALPSDHDLPDGGENGKLLIGDHYAGGFRATVFGVRIFNVPLSPAQVAESHRRTMIGQRP